MDIGENAVIARTAVLDKNINPQGIHIGKNTWVDAFDEERSYYNETCHLYNSANLRGGYRVLHKGAGNKTDFSFRNSHNGNTKCHKSYSPDLNQAENNRLSKEGPVCICIYPD